MAFSNHLNILPDPNNAIGNAGETGGTAGPGFASVQLTSDQPTMRDFTNSGRLLARAIARHQWKVNISYNPMTETEFNRVYSFLLHRRGGVNPFFVSLPQYRTPQDSTFATYAASNNLEAIASYAAGTTQVIISKTGYNNSTNKTPLPGDLFKRSDIMRSQRELAQMQYFNPEKFDVKVDKVRTINFKGKMKNTSVKSNDRVLRTSGYRSNWKKAIVTLIEGEQIDLVGGEL